MAVTVKPKALREIACALARSQDDKMILRFLESLLTPSEIREISSRWELVKLLDRGLSQRHIARRLGLSLCKITRGSRELKKRGSAFKAMIECHKRKSASRPRPICQT